MTIDILDWNITYVELMYWISKTGAELTAITGLGGMYSGTGTPSTKYIFRNEEDYNAFKLAFKKISR